ncbi:WVD2-like protein 4 [Tanacetum coccineum]
MIDATNCGTSMVHEFDRNNFPCLVKLIPDWLRGICESMLRHVTVVLGDDELATNFMLLHLSSKERGRSKQEEFMKKVQEMMVEQEKQRIPIAQPLPLTTDEPECLVKPPVKESTGPVDLVLHSDVRAVDQSKIRSDKIAIHVGNPNAYDWMKDVASKSRA